MRDGSPNRPAVQPGPAAPPMAWLRACHGLGGGAWSGVGGSSLGADGGADLVEVGDGL